MDKVVSSVQELTKSFESFKQAQQARVTQLEKRFLSSARPGLSWEAQTDTSEESLAHKQAFQSYLRKGDDKALLSLSCTKSLSTGSDVDGGYLVPQVLSENLRRDLQGLSSIRQLASVMTVSASAVEILLSQSGEEAGWVAETGERAETGTPKLVKKRIAVNELYARPRATQKLLEDSLIDVEAWLSQKIARRMAQLENAAFIAGDGQQKPKGFLSYASTLKADLAADTFEHVKTGVDGAFTDENGADVLMRTMEALDPQYAKEAVWVMSASAHGAIRRLKDQNGQFLWNPALSQGAPETLLGYPVVIVEGMPELVSGTASTSIVFGNFKEAYQIVDRAGTYVLRDPYSAKPYVEFYTVRRVGGDVLNFNALKMVRFQA
ncbi:MAG: phage major capsid protein [Alphaproteobacteria bacterium]|jgi:HK97 family phage major capsid protein|nr:phage major capsid protein [Alphaproteobacteria bacterium]